MQKINMAPAAFGRLCVETIYGAPKQDVGCIPAAFGRLCVETIATEGILNYVAPAAFGRLCVETFKFNALGLNLNQPPSGGCVLKLAVITYFFCAVYPAAFGRLCVETPKYRRVTLPISSSRLRAAVC